MHKILFIFTRKALQIFKMQVEKEREEGRPARNLREETERHLGEFLVDLPVKLVVAAIAVLTHGRRRKS